MAASIVYATWTTTGGHIKRVPPTGGAPQTLTPHEGYYLDPVFTPDGSRVVFLAGAASDQLYSILLDTPPPDDGPRRRRRGEIGGVNPPNTLEIRWMPAAGGAPTLVASAQSGRGPHFARNDAIARLLTTPRGLQSITMDGLDRRTHPARPGRRPRQQPARRRRDPPLARRHARVREPAEQALPRHRAARRARDGRGAHHGPRREHDRAGEAAVARRRRLSRLDRRRRRGHLGAGARSSSARPLDAVRRPQKTDVVVELPRARPKGSRAAHRRPHRHDEGRRGDRQRRRPRHRQPDRGRRPPRDR